MGTPLSGVSATAAGSEKGGATDIDGRFVITLNAGTHTIRLSSVGYSIKELSDIEVTSGNITNMEVVLETAAKTETEIVITGYCPQKNRRYFLLAHFLYFKYKLLPWITN